METIIVGLVRATKMYSKGLLDGATLVLLDNDRELPVTGPELFEVCTTPDAQVKITFPNEAPL